MARMHVMARGSLFMRMRRRILLILKLHSGTKRSLVIRPKRAQVLLKQILAKASCRTLLTLMVAVDHMNIILTFRVIIRLRLRQLRRHMAKIPLGYALYG